MKILDSKNYNFTIFHTKKTTKIRIHFWDSPNIFVLTFVPRYERIAWLKIIGVPFEFWDEENFSLIASRFGKVINPFDSISSRRDYSMGKVGILTTRKTWINEDVTIEVSNTKYKVGVVEYTDDWSPFKPVPFDKVEESNDEEEDYDEIS